MDRKNSYLKIVKLDTVSSTNDYAFALAEAGAREITVVSAKHQTKGKGRRGRKWISPKNKGLYVSFIFRPDKEFNKVYLLGMTLALAITKALSEILSINIKWPNDLMVGNKKIGGVLVETSSSKRIPAFTIVGLGLNINNSPDELPRQATSLATEKQQTYSLEKIFKIILKEVIIVYARFKRDDTAGIINEISAQLTTLGKTVTAQIGAKKINGKAYAIDDCGALLIKDSQGKKKRILTSQVQHLR